MAFELNTLGLQTQSIGEIKSELETKFRNSYGDNVNLLPDSVFGILIGIIAFLYWTGQQIALKVYNAFSVLTAIGTQLDKLVAYSGTQRKAATNSTAQGRFHGTPGTVIANGSLVRLIQTQSEWEVVDGPYVIGGGGIIDGTIQAVETGPIQALTTNTSGWEIITVIAGWDAFETLEDADLGLDEESDNELRERHFLNLYKNGNDLVAIRAAVLSLTGVSYVKVFENTSLITNGDGLPGKAFEVLVDGGVDEEIVQAIGDTKPAGILAYGETVTLPYTDQDNNNYEISFSRPTDIDIWIKVTITTTGAEEDLPPNAIQSIEDALLEFANANHEIGDNVVPDYFIGTVYGAVGNKSIINVLVQLSTISFVAATDAVINIGIRERADFDSARIQVLEV
jgi:uncharacterized phage protein gp47/JayE